MKKVIIYVCITAFLFGTMEVALKIGGSSLDSFQLTFLRFLIGGLMLLPFGIAEMRKKKVKLNGKDVAYLLLVGIMGIAISMLLFQLGVERCNASTASVLICINPIFTMIIAYFFAGEGMSGMKIFSLIISVVALIFMIRPWQLQEGNTVKGVILMLLAAVTFSIYTVMGKKAVAKTGVMAQTSLSFLMGSLTLMVVTAVMRRPILEGVSHHIPLILYIGICVTGIGYLCYFKAIEKSDAGTGSVAFMIKPAIAPVIAVIILHETLMWNTIVGIILLIGASVINLKENRRLDRLSDRYENAPREQRIDVPQDRG